MVNWDGNVLIIMELDKNDKDLKLQYGVIIYGIHWQCSTTITHGGCENIVLDNGNGNAIEAIENCGIV